MRSQHGEAVASTHGAAGASFVTFKGERNNECDERTKAAEKRDIRKLMKEFSVSNTVKSVAREYLLTGGYMRRRS